MTEDHSPLFPDEGALAAYAMALGAETCGPLDPLELSLPVGPVPSRRAVEALRRAIRAGGDPLGVAFTGLRSAATRRPMGATYTPREIVEAMTRWASEAGTPTRVVDPGSGSGRYIVAAGWQFPRARLVAVELDPLAALMTRASLAAAGMADRSTVLLSDYCTTDLGRVDGSTLYIGNPPYVRHHQIDADAKTWLNQAARNLDLTASKLAGLHVYFYLATAIRAAPGDFGTFITSSEWLDVNYGSLVRQLLLGPLGGRSVHVLEPTAMPFADAATTGAITTFEIGSTPTSLRLKRVAETKSLADLSGGRPVRRERLAEAPRWTPLLTTRPKLPSTHIELGELCRVHRGAVTGANHIWIASPHAQLPSDLLCPSVTKAKELFGAGDAMHTDLALRRVIDLPRDLDEVPDADRESVDRFLVWAKAQGAHTGYIARHLPAWWSVGLRSPAPILATYMARRPPAFVRNLAEARHINIAHGLYPRTDLSAAQLDALAAALRASVTTSSGRTYAGGLTKFEPREMERLPVPAPESLAADAAATTPSMD